MEPADESQGEAHCGSPSLRRYRVSLHRTLSVSLANQVSAGLSVIVRIKYIVDVSLSEDFMFATAVRDYFLSHTSNAVLGNARLMGGLSPLACFNLDLSPPPLSPGRSRTDNLFSRTFLSGQ